MIDRPCTYVCHLCSSVVYMNSRVLMHLLAYHGNGYSCNFTVKYGRGGAELMARGEVGSGGLQPACRSRVRPQ